jgi:protease-4
LFVSEETQSPEEIPSMSSPPDTDGSAKKNILVVLLVFGGLFLSFFIFAAVLLSAMNDDGLSLGQERIGIVEIEGPIMESKSAIKNLNRFVDDDSIKGIVVRVNSPGGAVAPSQEIYEAVKRAKDKKPLAVSMGSTAASGGYYIAVGADKIFANSGSVTGSIGVVTQLFSIDKVMEKLDVDVNTITTGPYKDAGSPFREWTARDEAYFGQLIDDIHTQFVEDVADGRKMDVKKVREFADGRVFTGRQAKSFKLIDEIGTLHDTVAWVASEAGLEGDPKTVYPPEERPGFLSELVKGSVDTVVQEARARTTPMIEYRYIGPQ